MERNGAPVVYEIQVRGHLDLSWSDWFNGMQITYKRGQDNAPVTVLAGAIRDQAALHGILARVRDLNLVLISLVQLAR